MTVPSTPPRAKVSNTIPTNSNAGTMLVPGVATGSDAILQQSGPNIRKQKEKTPGASLSPSAKKVDVDVAVEKVTKSKKKGSSGRKGDKKSEKSKKKSSSKKKKKKKSGAVQPWARSRRGNNGAGWGLNGTVYPTEPLDEKAVQALAREQIEFYLSPRNLCRDVFLRRHMDCCGYIPLPFLANFNRICQLTTDLDVVRSCCRESSLIDIDEENDKIRVSSGWDKWLFPNPEGGFGLAPWIKPNPNSSVAGPAVVITENSSKVDETNQESTPVDNIVEAVASLNVDNNVKAEEKKENVEITPVDKTKSA